MNFLGYKQKTKEQLLKSVKLYRIAGLLYAFFAMFLSLTPFLGLAISVWSVALFAFIRAVACELELRLLK